MIDEDLRTFVISTLGDEWEELGKITEGFNIQSALSPRIWYRRSSHNRDLLLAGPSGIATTEFDIECVSDDIDDSQDLAAELKTAFNGYAGEMGDSTVLLAEVQDHDDDYQPQSLGDADAGLHMSTLKLSILHT